MVPAQDAGQITVDTKDPSVEVTAPAAGMTVLNGATITISATVTDATDVTVTADVSALDSGATGSVTLTDGTGTHTITEANTNDNGEYTITVTATDAAGNTGTGTGSGYVGQHPFLHLDDTERSQYVPRAVGCRRY